jgi:hypothetical protein
LVDKDKDKDKHAHGSRDDEDDREDNEDDGEEHEYSISRFQRNKRSATIPKINVFGTDIKLDFLTIAALALGSIGALGAGYVVYDQYNKGKTMEEEKRKYIEQERLRQQAIADQYLRAEQAQRRMAEMEMYKKRMNSNNTNNNEGLVNMDQFDMGDDDNRSSPPIPQMTYEQMLNQKNHYEPNYRQMALNSTRQRQQEEESSPPPVINMDNLYPIENEQPPPQQQFFPSVPNNNKRQPTQQQQQEEYEDDYNQQGQGKRGPTPEELYASMNENQSYY